MQDVLRTWRETGRLDRVLILVLLLPLLPIAWLVFNNFTCEFSLDRTEYEHLAQISRVYQDKPIYTEMTFEFVPITYTPLYWEVSGMLWKLVGPGFFMPRIVSLVASLVVFWLVAAFLWEATSKDLLLTAAGTVQMVLVSVYAGFWLFQVNVNPLHFATTIAGFYCLRNTSAWSLMRAAIWLSLGVLAKQTGLAYVAAAAVFVLLKEPRRFLAYAIPALVVCGGSLAFLQLSSNGKFYDIVVRENLGPPWEIGRLINEVWGAQFLGQTGMLCLFSLWPLVRGGTLRDAWARMVSPEYAMAGSGLLVASIAQPKMGSGSLHAVIAIAGLVICGWQGLRILVDDLRSREAASRFRELAVALQTVLLLVPALGQTSIQFIDGVDRDRFAEITNVFKRGYTVMYHYPYLPTSFGYPEAGNFGNELCRWVDGQWSFANKPDFFSQPYRDQRFDYVILGASVIDQNDPQIQAILENYSVVRQLPFHPTKPNSIMLRYPIFILKAKRLL